MAFIILLNKTDNKCYMHFIITLVKEEDTPTSVYIELSDIYGKLV